MAIRKWWFLGLVILFQLVPPYATGGYDLRQWGLVNAYILTHTIKSSFAGIYPVFQIISILLLVGFVFAANRVTRLLLAGAWAVPSATRDSALAGMYAR